MKAKMDAPLSCCDVKKEIKGLSIQQKSCCDNVTVLQDNVLVKPSVDFDHFIMTVDLINGFETVEFNLLQAKYTEEKVEIPPPPNIHSEHSQEKLQVYMI